MARSFALTRDAWALVALFVIMALSQLLLDPAYTGYLVAYAVFVAIRSPQLLTRQRGFPFNGVILMGWVAFAILAAGVTILAKPAFRDLFRDSGAIFSFLFGLFIVPRALGRDWERPLFAGLAALSIFVSLWTILGAGLAYLAGAGAYEWRGVYIPFAHTWLPYLVIVEYIRSRSGSDIRLSMARLGLCLLALLLSLSRTGIALVIVFGLVTLALNTRRWLFTGRGITLFLIGLVAAAIVLPELLQLNVVQQRIDAGVGQDDLSLAWRYMEVQTATDYLNDGGLARWLFGFGLGARLPLPFGIVDFAGNISIPHLHNSYWTIVLKFGVVGLAWILLNIGLLFLRAHIVRGGAPVLVVGGSWILVFVMGTAYTLQGMSEWSHLLFLGISCAMLRKAGHLPQRARGPATIQRAGRRTVPAAAVGRSAR